MRKSLQRGTQQIDSPACSFPLTIMFGSVLLRPMNFRETFMPRKHIEINFVQPVLTGSTSNWHAAVREIWAPFIAISVRWMYSMRGPS